MAWFWLVLVSTLLYEVSSKAAQQTTTSGLGWWTEWEEWGHCAGKCEWGIKHRWRNCPDSYCLGAENESRACDIYSYCSEGDWSLWGPYDPYSDCDKTCGEGQMTAQRKRECLSVAENATCEGPTVNYSLASCNPQPCFLHGGWSHWREWTDSVCSTTCDYGRITRTRLRTCTNPQPTGGGRTCEGDHWYTYTIACHNAITCEITSTVSTTTESAPKWNNPVAPITISMLVGVPCVIALYCFYGAAKNGFGRTETATQKGEEGFDIYDDDEDWHRKGRSVPNVRVDIPNTHKKMTVITK